MLPPPAKISPPKNSATSSPKTRTPPNPSSTRAPFPRPPTRLERKRRAGFQTPRNPRRPHLHPGKNPPPGHHRRLPPLLPRAGIEAEGPDQFALFNDFNGIDAFDKKVDFYHHDQHWSNRMILGDSLLVMNSLAEKEGLKGQVQTIYFDPPYGIKFGSNWQVSTRKRDVKDGKVPDITRQPEQILAFRDTWKLGIHSYLSYLRERLVISRAPLGRNRQHFCADRR